MKIAKQILSFNTQNKNQIIPITNKIKKFIADSGIVSGTFFAYSLHTTMSLIIQEAVEKYLCKDIIGQLTKIVDDDGHKYKHTCAKHPSGTCKLDDFNGPSHVRQMLTNQNLILDIEDSQIKLGRWQDIALLELDGPRKDRQILLKIVSD
jgi:secondary thiamine-phosphate synthase enzyme